MTPTATPPAIRLKTIDQDLRHQLAQFRERSSLSLVALGKKLAYSEGMVSKYLADKFEGDVQGFENNVRDLLKSDSIRASVIDEVETFPTIVLNQVKNALEMVRKNSHVGLVFGDAGVGKTRAIGHYVSENPLTLAITLSRCAGSDSSGLVGSIWRQVDTSIYKAARDGTRGAFLVERLRGNGRLIVVDNAHRLTRTAREWLFDFHDATGCPVALVGNPELLDAIKLNDQQFSRIGLRLQADLKNSAGKAAEELLRRVWPEALQDLALVAAKVATHHGHLRSLWHQLRIAREMHSSKGSLATPAQAFASAHALLVRNYDL